MGSIMVSYIKARAESLGQKEFRGLMQRPERIILLIAGTVLNAPINHYLLGLPGLHPQGNDRHPRRTHEPDGPAETSVQRKELA